MSARTIKTLIYWLALIAIALATSLFVAIAYPQPVRKVEPVPIIQNVSDKMPLVHECYIPEELRDYA